MQAPCLEGDVNKGAESGRRGPEVGIAAIGIERTDKVAIDLETEKGGIFKYAGQAFARIDSHLFRVLKQQVAGFQPNRQAVLSALG